MQGALASFRGGKSPMLIGNLTLRCWRSTIFSGHVGCGWKWWITHKWPLNQEHDYIIHINKPLGVPGIQKSQTQKKTKFSNILWMVAKSAVHGKHPIIWGCIKTNLAIFGGMNIHKSQLFWGSLGTRVLTHPHIPLFIGVSTSNSVFPRSGTGRQSMHWWQMSIRWCSRWPPWRRKTTPQGESLFKIYG